MKTKRNLTQYCLAGTLLMLLPAVAQAQFTYTNNNEAVTITGYTGSNGVVMIPSTIDGLPVTSIGGWAFYDTSITNVLIPDSVTNIGGGAFFDCISLTNVTIGSRVTSIGDWTFGFCTSLVSINCRGYAPSLGGSNVFYGNAAMIYYLPGTTGWEPTFDGHPAILWNPPVPFNYATNGDGITLTITRYTGFGGAVVMPESIDFLPVTGIGGYAFGNCTALTNIVLADSVNSMGAGVFYDCTSLLGIVIPGPITDLGDYTFQNCTSLASAVVPNSITNIGSYVFAGCTRLQDFTVPNGVLSIGGNAFQYCSSLTNVTLPDTVTNIGDGAFQNCSNLISVEIPNSVTRMGGYVFNACTSLASVTIGTNLPDIGSEMFANCHSLTNIVIPDGVVSVADYAFLFSGLTSVAISRSVTNIGDWAFSGCSNLAMITVASENAYYSSVAGVLFDKKQTLLVKYPDGRGSSYAVPDGVSTIGTGAFGFSSVLTNVTIPNTVTNIEDWPFYYASSLTAITVDPGNAFYSSVDGVLFNQDQTVLIKYPESKADNYSIPDTVTTLWPYAFYNNAYLTNIVVPDSVTNLGFNAFSYCSNLISATLGNRVTGISGGLFESDTNLARVIIGSGVIGIGYEAFASCTSLKGLYFQTNAPTLISQYAFFGSSQFTAYYLPGTTGWNIFHSSALWLPEMQMAGASLGAPTKPFSFNINWAIGQTVVVEACTNLANPVWQPVRTNLLTTGSANFNDPQWTNYPRRFYRIRSP